MNNPRELAAELQPDVDIPWPNKALMVPIFKLIAPAAFRPYVVFENGEASEALWEEQLGSDAGTVVNMSHAEEVDAVLMAPITQGNRALRQMQNETLVVARENLAELPCGLGAIVRHGGTLLIKRVFESPNETPEEKEERQNYNSDVMDKAIIVVEVGGSVVVFIEGGTGKRILLPGGTYKTIPREPDEQLPAQEGFANIIDGLSPDARDKARMMTVVSRYNPRLPNISRYNPKRFTRLMNPTSVILDPVKPVDGTVAEIRQQGEEEMARGYKLVKEFDELR